MTDDLRDNREAIEVPTIVIDGSATFPFLHNTAEIAVKAIAGAMRSTLEGQQHDVAPDVIVPMLIEFFKK